MLADWLATLPTMDAATLLYGAFIGVLGTLCAVLIGVCILLSPEGK